MRYRSVCTGIAAETVAWHPLGWQALSFSEIEPFCCSLLKHRYPEVPNYGDFTKITHPRCADESTDLLMGGTPCQSFSVAGRRGGLDDARGNLALEFVRLAQRLRARWVVWENVKGVLSSDGGEALGSFLGALAECGYGFAYRVFDAQFDGLAQRRQRVFVIGYLGDWRPPAAVLFERESLRRDTAPSREAREATPGVSSTLARNGNHTAGTEAETGLLTTYFNLDSRTKIDGDVARVLKSDQGSGGRGCVMAFDAKQAGNDAGELSPTLRATPHDKSHANGGGGIAIAQSAAVRRLTPVEWSRLMGLPDDYTAIPYHKKPAADGPRYRAIGNSISVPTLRWIGQRIDMVEKILADGALVLHSQHGKESRGEEAADKNLPVL